MDGGSFRVGGMCSMVAYPTDEATAFNDDVDMGGHKELDAATESVDVYLLVLGNDGLAQIHSDAAAEGIEAGTVERFAAIDILVAAIVN